MKHIFVMNPAAGKGKAGEIFLPKIIETAKRMAVDYEIHRTIAPGDAEHFVRVRCEALKRDSNLTPHRFYACGGDGTLNEAANGAYGYSNAEIAMIPAGTGNDFPKMFGSVSQFEDIEKQICGSARTIDLIRYEAVSADDALEATVTVRYAINMFNIGLDCNVADEVVRIKQYPFVSGTFAYILGIGVVLGKKEGVTLKICFDDDEIQEGEIMLTAIGNGCYCGGGFKGVPNALIDDGLMDVSIVGKISRRKFLSLIGKYRKGTYLYDPATAGIINYKKCRSLKIIPCNKMKICVDGEISTVGQTTFEIVPHAIKFSVPQGCE